MKKKLLYGLAIVVLFIIGFLVSRNGNDEKPAVKRTRFLMGTVVEIQVRDADEEKAQNAIQKAFDEMSRVDDQFSSYDKEGPVWKINHSGESKFNVSNEIYDMFAASDSLWKLSGGAMDVSLESLTEAWGFSGSSPAIPADSSIAAALQKAGFGNVHLLGEGIISRDKNVMFNFGAIAKGYAVDRAVKVLKDNGIHDALVNAGGEIRAVGDEWLVGIQHPRFHNRLVGTLKLNGKSVATSGDYEQYFEVDGKRYCHIMNPATGAPASGCRSVTVIAGSDMIADGLSTAVFVLGPEKGLSLIGKLPGIEAMVIDSTGKTSVSSGFNNYLLRN